MNDTDPGGPLILLASTLPQGARIGAFLAGLFFLLLYAYSIVMETALPAYSNIKKTNARGESQRKSAGLRGIFENKSSLLRHIRLTKLCSLFIAASCWSFLLWQGLFVVMSQQGWAVPGLWVSLIYILFLTIAFSFFSELPAQYARQHAESVFQRRLRSYQLLSALFLPLSALLIYLMDRMLRAFHLNPEQEAVTLSESEWLELLNQQRDQQSLPNEEQSMIENFFDFRDKTVDECMTHRVDLVAVDIDTELPELLHILKTEKFTRIPVYRNDIDHICGFLHSRDLLLQVMDGKEDQFCLSDLLRECHYTPESTKIAALFRDMQRRHIHLSIVIDEYGGTSGLVTMEDLLEEIVGEIQDEYDEEEPEIQNVSQDKWICDGGTSLEDIAEKLQTELPVDDYDTIAGFVIDLLDRIPEENERPEISYGSFRFKVLKMEEKRVVKVLIQRKAPEPPMIGDAKRDEKS